MKLSSREFQAEEFARAAVLHTTLQYKPSKVEGICDIVRKARLIIRKDDRACKSVISRLQLLITKTTAPLKDYYE